MADFDIFNPSVSKVVAGIDGKCILTHSEERKLGKTAQACRMPKPYYLRFEQGINAIDGIPYAELTSWRDFKKVNKQLTDPKNLQKAKELYTTIIFDTVDVAIKWCESYVCACGGVTRINDGNNGYGLWKEYENEWFNEINKLTNAGYAVFFISHSQEKTKHDPVTGEEYIQMCPKGDKRTMDLILDLVDFIGYVKSNGFDEEGQEIPSSIYFANTKEFQAGSRFKHMPKVIQHYTAEALQDAIKEAVRLEEQENGSKAITFAEKKEVEKKEKISFEDLMNKVQAAGEKLAEAGHMDDLLQIVEDTLGVNKKVSACTERQYDAVAVILDDLNDKIEELGL